jgi:hypothetical protein
MISLFTKSKVTELNLLKLPSYAVAQKEAEALASKREAQLQWMRERGMAYLGDPMKLAELRAKRRPGPRSVRRDETADRPDGPDRETSSRRR